MYLSLFALGLTVAAVCAGTLPTSYADKTVTAAHFAMAAAYSQRHGGETLRVDQDGACLFEDYANGYSADTPHKIYSGTKSFIAVLCAIAQRDQLLSFGEPACATITEWQGDSRSQIIIRQLLAQNDGLDPDAGTYIYPYRNQLAAALRVPLIDRPGSRFHYGAVNYQALGEILQRKLHAGGTDLESYMHEKLLDPLGINVTSWKEDDAGEPMIHTGLELSTAQWIKFGDFLATGRARSVPISRSLLLPLFIPDLATNPAYGLGFWLNHPQHSPPPQKLHDLVIAMDGRQILPGGPAGLFACIGSGRQRLYIWPAARLAIARFGYQTPFSDGDFLSRLLRGIPQPESRR